MHIDEPHTAIRAPKGMIQMSATILTTAQVADALDTTPRNLRKFLRSDASSVDSVGKGHRYAITASQVKSLRTRFNKWNADQAPKADTTPETPTDA